MTTGSVRGYSLLPQTVHRLTILVPTASAAAESAACSVGAPHRPQKAAPRWNDSRDCAMASIST